MAIERPQPHQQIPPEAKKVFEGILYDAYQWPQKLFNGETATYERLRRNDSVVILPVTERGTILVGREQQPGTEVYTAIPCGGVDDGEAPEIAAARELLEETGYVAGELDFWFAHQVEHRVDWAIFVFIARGCKLARKQDPGAGERIELKEVSFSEFLNIATEDDFQNINIAPKLLKAVLDPQEMISLKKRLGL